MPNAAAPRDDGLTHAAGGRTIPTTRGACLLAAPLDNRGGKTNLSIRNVAGRVPTAPVGATIPRRALASATSVVWLLLGEGQDPSGLCELSVGDATPRPLTPGLLDEARAGPPDVVVAAASALSPADAVAWLELGAALVVTASPERAAEYLALSESHAVIVAPEHPGIESLRLSIASAGAARRRLLRWKGEADRLRRRLEDRIVIERAKGVLVRLWGATEEEAYKRLQAYARQNRKQIREVAQALLESHALLGPPEPAETPREG
jgi:AmiR/NasT family two-component response regulator